MSSVTLLRPAIATGQNKMPSGRHNGVVPSSVISVMIFQSQLELKNHFLDFLVIVQLQLVFSVTI